MNIRPSIIALAVFFAYVLALPGRAQTQATTPHPAGEWRGTSLCTVRPSSCNNEVVVYRISRANDGDSLSLDARKIVNGQEDEMGVLGCLLTASGTQFTCTMRNGVWHFATRGDSLVGELRLPDNTKFRDVRAARQPAGPNVVLILMDDMGYGDIGSYGVTDASTPNLDRLAREGVRLTDAYSNGSDCSPTRAGFITGQYQQRYGIEWPLGAAAADSARGLPPTGATLPALLKSNGYRTGLIGKWHLGFKPEFGPMKHGFDEFFGFVGGAVDYYTHKRGDGTPDLYDDTTAVETPAYLTDEITRRAVGFVGRNAQRPFFLEVAYNAVHWPFEPPDMPSSSARPRSGRGGALGLYQGPSDSVPATRHDYVKMLERADRGVGQLLAALDRAGLARNTLVIFTNDNGGEWLSRNAPLTDRKTTLWEGGIRVPLIMRWSGVLPAHTTSRQVAITMDLTATILSVTKSPVPPSHRLEGIDLLPAVSGRSALVKRELFWRTKRGAVQRAVRSGDWKLFQEGINYYLFDVAADPGERRDLTAQHQALVRQLSAKLDAWEKDVDSPNPELPQSK